jgi:hypothetical protein
MPTSTHHRRDALRVGGLTALGLTLPDLCRLRASGASPPPRAKSCILLWLDGGPSHLETFDLKPDAPSEVRGPFRPTDTNVPGVRVCELMANTARVMDKVAVVRSVTSPLGEHGLANHYLMTGYKPSPVLDYPSYGAVLSHTRGGSPTLPAYVAVPDAKATAGAGFLGAAHRPFAVGSDPARPDFRVRDLDFYPGVTTERVERRREFVTQLDRFQQEAEAEPPTADPGFEQAYRLVTSPEAKRAFDLSRESTATRARYGPRTFGQSCLLARRLVERGVGFVTVNFPGWDTHANLVVQLKEGYAGAREGVGLIPTFDRGFAALVNDLADRGLLDETLVVAMGEFGRTPKLNTQGGRDHWPRVFSVALAGGGVKGGQVVGASDRVGESPSDRPVTPADLARTIYTLLGIDPDRELQTADGRPVQINQGGQVVRELLS